MTCLIMCFKVSENPNQDIFTHMMERMADAQKPQQVEARYEILRAARELERFGDLVTNIAERVIYLTTGNLEEINI